MCFLYSSVFIRSDIRSWDHHDDVYLHCICIKVHLYTIGLFHFCNFGYSTASSLHCKKVEIINYIRKWDGRNKFPPQFSIPQILHQLMQCRYRCCRAEPFRNRIQPCCQPQHSWQECRSYQFFSLFLVGVRVKTRRIVLRGSIRLFLK